MKTLLARWLAPLSSALLLIAPASPAEQAIPETQPRPSSPRFLHAHYAWPQHKMLEDDNPSVTVHAYVQAHGLREQTMMGKVELRHRDGRPVRAVLGAPKQFFGSRGLFQSVASDKVRYDEAKWDQFHVFVPFSALALPTRQRQQLILTFRASCGGLTSMAESDVIVPAPGKADLVAGRGIKIVSIVESPSLISVPSRPTYSPPQPAGMGLEGLAGMGLEAPRLEDAPPGLDISGLMLTGHVQVDEMRGETMTAEIRLRRPNGNPVMAAKGAPAGYADEKRCFVSRFSEKVPSDKAEWKSIHLWVPFAALDLAPGRQHKLILTFLASAGGLTATREQDIALRLPGAQAPGQHQEQVLPGPASEPQVRETEPEIVLDAEQHSLARVKELLDVGKLTPEELFLSAKKNEKSVVRFLLDNGADVFARDLEGRTPLHVAAANGHREIAAMLIPASISPRGPKKPDKPPPTPGEKKESKALFEFDAEYLESLSFDKFLENAHCYVSLTDDNGSTPLHLAASNGHYDVADLLVDGTDVNAANKEGRTPLHAAAVAGDDAIVALLLLKGADAKVRDEKGNTPSDVATSDSVKRRLKKAAGAAAPTADSEDKVVRAA